MTLSLGKSNISEIYLKYCTFLVVVKLDSGNLLLLLSGQVFCETGGQFDGALRGG